MEIHHSTYHTEAAIGLHVVEAGDSKNDTIIFLHGFPEHWYGWHKQLRFFAEKGYHVVVPDQRGYNLSSKPSDVQEYTLEKLTGDIVKLIAQLQKQQVILVGHDWGGAVAWAMGMHFPHLLQKLVILNMPHPAVMEENLQKNPSQMLKSWYTGFFQAPFLPEKTAEAFDFKFLVKSMTGTAREGAFTEEDLVAYKEAWQQPNAIEAMINWYRAYKYSSLFIDKEVETPTLLIWGKNDATLGQEMAEPSIGKCPNGKLEFLNNATHWLHHEEPARVNKLISVFLGIG
ncbi:alpha/beta fold hydrolase [Pontibacter sp. SGAir0037]|uniref:alpha/beta fold hydrolase n=1 Tax=Pontibacter sp. SGAir0037 TaxID=2571030 RepID=UPI0010CD4465|nr:alpha/beta hydrolase [Pontibacter sp. SGAir0037]QCR22217.1 alpha/beta hydrolase [Pontibacter sp. SGAir0037]